MMVQDVTEALRNIPIEKFAQIEYNIKTRVKLLNYKPVLDLGCNLISEIINFRNGKVSLLSDRKIEDRATYEQGEKDTEKYRIN